MDVKEYIDENYPESDILLADGLDAAFLGVGTSFNQEVACYDKEIVIQILVNEGMTEDEALEFFEVNIGGAYVGENTPMFVERCV